MANKSILKLLKLLEQNLLWLSCVIMLLPFIVLSAYIHPYADDYTYAHISNTEGFWNAQKMLFNRINGRFVTNFIQSFDILHGRYRFFYKLFPLLSIFLQTTTLFILIKSIFRLKNFRTNISFALVLFCIYITQMAKVSEGLYWWSTTANYQLANILGVCFLICNIKIIQNRNKITYTFFACLLAILLVGTSETTFLMLAIFCGLNFIFKSLQKRKIDWYLAIITLFFIVAMGIPFLSSSTKRMGNMHSGLHFLKAIVFSSTQYGMSFIGWSGLVILFGLIIINLVDLKTIKNNPAFQVNPFVALITFSLTIIAGFFSGFFGAGEILPPRARHTVNFFFIVGLTYLFFLFLLRKQSVYESLTNLKSIKHLLFFIGFSFLLGSNNSVNAIKDLGKRRAYRFDKIMEERNRIAEEAPKDSPIIFEAVKYDDFPITIYPRDFHPKDPNYVYNYWYRIYWQLGYVTLDCLAE